MRKLRLEAEANSDEPIPKPIVKSREQRRAERLQQKRIEREKKQAEKKAKAEFKKNPIAA